MSGGDSPYCYSSARQAAMRPDCLEITPHLLIVSTLYTLHCAVTNVQYKNEQCTSEQSTNVQSTKYHVFKTPL